MPEWMITAYHGAKFFPFNTFLLGAANWQSVCKTRYKSEEGGVRPALVALQSSGIYVYLAIRMQRKGIMCTCLLRYIRTQILSPHYLLGLIDTFEVVELHWLWWSLVLKRNFKGIIGARSIFQGFWEFSSFQQRETFCPISEQNSVIAAELERRWA